MKEHNKFFLISAGIIIFFLSFVIITTLPGMASANQVNIGGTALYYSLIQDAYNAAINADTILSRDVTFGENLIFDRDISIALDGGYDSSFSTNTGKTVINGNMTISSGTVTIGNINLTDNGSALPTVQWTAASQASANESGIMTVTAQLSAVSGVDVTVPFTITGTATGGGTDYTITASPITITAGATTGAATITIADDALAEGSETVILTMGTSTNATLGATTEHTATITDDEPALLTVQWTAASQASANESGAMTVTAQLSAASGVDVTVPYTVTGTATGGGTDYAITASPITITAGSTTGTATITIAADTSIEGNETVILTMGTPTNAALGSTTVYTATITDDDGVQPVLISTFGRGSYNIEGELNFPSGVTVDTAGYVYVCTDNSPSISKFDSDGNFITRWFVNDCLGLDADSQNNIYVAAKTANKIVKYDSIGNLLLQWGTSGSGQGQFKKPNDLAVNKNLGLVYVADSENYRIQVFDINGTFIEMWGWGVATGSSAFEICTSGCQSGIAGSGNGQFSATRGPLGIAVDESTGWVYVADSDAHRIQKFDHNGVFLGKWGTTGMGEGQFLWPRNVDVDSNGLVYVIDGDMERIEVFDGDGNLVLIIAGTPYNDPQSDPCFFHNSHTDCYALHNAVDGPFHPRDVAVDSQNGFIYVAATYANRIDKFDIAGNFLDTWGNYEKSNGVFNRPKSMAIDALNGYIYVADMNNFLIQQFDLNGTFLTDWGYSERVSVMFDGGDGSFDFPQTVAADDQGNVYVTRTGATYPGIGPIIKRIQKFDQNGNWLFSWNISDPLNPGQLHTHKSNGIVYNPANGYIYVSTYKAIFNQYKLIQYFSVNGDYVGEFGEKGSADGQLSSPAKLAVDRNTGDIYVVDVGNNRIQKFSKDGIFLGKWGSYGSADWEFIVDSNSGIYVDDSGYVYLSDSGNRKIKVFDSNGNTILSFNFSGGDPGGLGVDSNGYIYVVDRYLENIRKYSPVFP